MKTKQQQKEQIQKLIRIINDRLINIQVLKGGLIMTNKTLLIVFKEHPQLKQEWDMLQIRRDNLRRLLWKLP